VVVWTAATKEMPDVINAAGTCGIPAAIVRNAASRPRQAASG
jgi:hypothetical protein